MRFQVWVPGPLGVRDSDTVEDAETCTRVDAEKAPMRALSMIPGAGTCTRADMGAGACAGGGLTAGGPALRDPGVRGLMRRGAATTVTEPGPFSPGAPPPVSESSSPPWPGVRPGIT